MANVKVSSYVAATIISATVSVGSVSASYDYKTEAISLAARASSISFTTELVPMRALAPESLSITDASPIFEIDKVSGDTLLISESPVMAVDIVKTDSVNVTDTPNKIINTSIDFDLSDPDVDPDPVNVSDVPVLNPSLAKTDSITASDSPIKQPNKITTDSVTMAQSIGPFNIGKNPSDSVTASESDSKTVTTARTDSASVIDSPAKTITPAGKTDSVTVADIPVKQPNKITTDSVTSAESIGPFSIGKNPFDSVTSSDSPEKTFTTARTDSVTSSDSPAKTFTTARTDSVTSSDAPVKNITPAGKTDSVTIAESFGPFTIGLNPTDTVNATESLTTQLILGESDHLYPTIVSVFDGAETGQVKGYHIGNSDVASRVADTQYLMNDEFGVLNDHYIGGENRDGIRFYNRVFEQDRFRVRNTDYSAQIANGDSLLNSTVIWDSATDGAGVKEFTGIINGAGLIGQPIVNSDTITYGDLVNAGLLVNFIYTDTSDSPTTGSHAVNGHFLNETPMGAGSH